MRGWLKALSCGVRRRLRGRSLENSTYSTISPGEWTRNAGRLQWLTEVETYSSNTAAAREEGVGAVVVTKLAMFCSFKRWLKRT